MAPWPKDQFWLTLPLAHKAFDNSVVNMPEYPLEMLSIIDTPQTGTVTIQASLQNVRPMQVCFGPL